MIHGYASQTLRWYKQTNQSLEDKHLILNIDINALLTSEIGLLNQFETI